MLEPILTENEFELLVRRKFKTNNFKIIEKCIKSHNPDEKIGFMGQHLRIEFTVLLNNNCTKFSLFLKCNARSEDPMARMSYEGQCFEREISYLRLINENWEIQNSRIQWAPVMYYSKSNQFFVLEYLNSLGFEEARNQKRTEIDLVHTKSVFRSLAEMHAFSIILEEKKRSEGYKLSKDFKFEEGFFNKKVKGGLWTQQGLECSLSLIELLPENNIISPAKFKELFRRKWEEIYEVLKEPSTQFLNVLCHGDLWLNNFLFKYKNDIPLECCLVDFQFVRHLPPVHDLLIYLYINTTTEFQHLHSETLFKLYYNHLTESLLSADLEISEILPWNSFLDSVKAFKPICALIGLMYVEVQIMDESYWGLFLEDMKFLEEFGFVNRSKYMVECYRTNPAFRARIIEVFVEIRNILIEDNLIN